MKVLDRLHSRAFTANILFMNAKELSDAIDLTENSEFMMKAFRVENHEESRQIHRETSRIVHNYLCSISTFIDHSRNFMNKHYEGTAFLNDYNYEVKRQFQSSELARFVRDLRNFMTHRELPDSQITLRMVRLDADSADDTPRSEITSGVFYKTARFREWDGWSTPAARFLKACGEKVTLRSIFEPHITIMRDFNIWFEERFRIHHKDELDELQQLQNEYARLQAAEAKSDASINSPFEVL